MAKKKKKIKQLGHDTTRDYAFSGALYHSALLMKRIMLCVLTLEALSVFAQINCRSEI